MDNNRNRERQRMGWRDERDTDQRSMSRESNYENFYPYPAMDDHYRMYRDYNDRSHYGREESYGRNDNYSEAGMGGRAGYMEFDSDADRSRTRISAYGYRNVGDRANYGHSGTNDPYDPRYHDRGRNMYGMNAGSYMRGRRDDDMRYDMSNDWDMRGRSIDPGRDRNYRDENTARIHYDVGINERNSSTWTGDPHMFNPYEDDRRRDDERRYHGRY